MIRPARPADAVALAHIGATAWMATFGDSMPPADAAASIAEHKSPGFFAAALARGEVYLIAERAGAPVGYIGLGPALDLEVTSGPPPGPRDVLITGLYVLPGHQGAGLGRALLRAGLAHPMSAGAPRVLLSVWAKNPRALALYRAHGFREAGRTQVRAGGRVVDTDMVLALEPQMDADEHG